jgi:uncharacterized tellurite resistance protein B-like protein
MYQQEITSAQQALTHLLLHCSYKDGESDEKEMHTILNIVSQLYGTSDVSLQQEKAIYLSYASRIKDEQHFLNFLIQLIKPAGRLALLWYCAQVTASDKTIAFSEELFISKVASMLHIHTDECRTIHMLALQIHAVEKSQMF